MTRENAASSPGGRLTGIRSVMDARTVGQMHDAAVAILGRTGMRVEHAEAREAIAKRSGFRPEGGRILIDAAQVEDWRRSTPPRKAASSLTPEEAPLGFLCSTSSRPSYVVDDDGQTVRLMTRRDVVEGAKLIDVLHERGLRGRTPGVPMDVPAALRPIEQFMIGAEHSRDGGGTSWVCDIPTAEILRDMNCVYGRNFTLEVWSPSGLVLGGPEMDILWHFRREVQGAAVGAMPTMGITGPCDLLGVFTLALAECLGAAAILHELLPGVPISITPHPEPADLRTGMMIFGSPEWELLDLMHHDVYAYYGQESFTKRLLTSAPVPDAQAMIEHATSAANGMSLGYRRFGPVGQLALDEVFSPAMLILDLDLLSHAYHASPGRIAGSEMSLESLPQIVDETIRQGMLFAEHSTTLDHMRRRYHQPRILRRMTRAQWTAAGCPEVVRDAQAEAKRLVRQYHHEPPRDVLRELRALYEKARQSLPGQGR